jgi:phage portal protein BeeE
MAFWDNFIKKRFIEPAIKPVIDELKKKDETIKVQQEKLELLEKVGNAPMHFATPFGVTEGTMGQDIYKWKKIVDFKTLRELSERYDVARACINRRKRQVEAVNWSITPVDPSEKAEKYRKDIERVKKFLDMPGGKYTRFKEFVAKIVEDLLVFDAAAIYKDKEEGELKKLIVVDAATIRLRVYQDGSTPEPPDIAYEQWVRGEKVAEFTTDEMVYLMLNPRSNSPYGLAPLETLILGVDAALKSQLYNLSMLSEGNIPEGFFTLPESWTPDQIKEFQNWFDAMISGNPRFQSRIKFMPGGKGVGFIPAKKPEEMRFLEYEKWLLLKTCALFDVPPEEIGFTEEMSRATAQVQQEVATKAGLLPILQVLKEFFDDIIQIDLGCPHLQFSWYSLDKKDELRDAEITQRLIPLGLVSVDEWRQQNDLPPIGLGHYIMTGAGPILVEDLLAGRTSNQKPQVEEETEMIIKELSQWERKCLNCIRGGKKFKPFVSKFIPEDVKKLINAQLLFAKTKADVKKIFEKQIAMVKQDLIMKKALKLKEEIGEAVREYANFKTGKSVV